MITTNNLHYITLLIFQFIFSFSAYSSQNKTQNNTEQTNIPTIDISLKKIQSAPDESFKNFSEIYAKCISQKDTSAAIRCLIGLGDIERFRGNYEASFDFLWDAFLFANKNNIDVNLIKINRNLGILYNIYNKNDLALKYLHEALHLSKHLVDDQQIKDHEIISCYYSIASYYRKEQEYDIALNYLDSCSLTNKGENSQPYVLADKGFIYMKKGQLALAEKCLFEAELKMLSLDERYHHVILSFIGDLKIAQSQPDSAIFYYKRSLEEIDRYNILIEFKPKLLEKLAKLFKEKGEYLQAYQYLEASKVSSDNLFSASNKRNSKLFEIKNKYKETLAEQKVFIQEQNTEINKQSKILLLLMVIIGFVLVLSFSIFMYNRQRLKIRKLALTHQMEKEKNDTVLEVKSKELTTYTLQMIEKEEAIKELLEIVKKEVPSSFNALRNKHTNGSKNLWNDFNMRFIKINGTFYETLKRKHPNLSLTEQKHCALIRLNLDSTEMAQILNISLQSIHTSRYRIRKKIGLTHEESLSNYIAKL